MNQKTTFGRIGHFFVVLGGISIALAMGFCVFNSSFERMKRADPDPKGAFDENIVATESWGFRCLGAGIIMVAIGIAAKAADKE